MAAYYNENDPFAAAWLRELIAAGHIAPGDVDERSILDVQPEDVRGYTQHHFFAGIGGWSLAARLAGWPDDRPLWTGSPPCQPFSCVGKRLGTADERHLAPHFLSLVAAVRPPFVAGEQVAAAVTKDNWLDDLLDALEREGYATGAAVLPACFVGSPHIRQRLWFVGWLGDGLNAGLEGHGGHGDDRNEPGRLDTQSAGSVAEAGAALWVRGECCDNLCPANAPDSQWDSPDWLFCRDGKWRPVEPGTFPLAHGLPRGVVPSGDPSSTEYVNNTQEARVMRLRGYGNAIVPQVAAQVLMEMAGLMAGGRGAK